MALTYRRTIAGVDWALLATIIQDAGLGHAIPADLERAYTNSVLVVFAYDHDTLIGAARAISDGVYHAQLCDMVVTPTRQRQGIGRHMAELLVHDLTGIKVLLQSGMEGGANERWDRLEELLAA